MLGSLCVWQLQTMQVNKYVPLRASWTTPSASKTTGSVRPGKRPTPSGVQPATRTAVPISSSSSSSWCVTIEILYLICRRSVAENQKNFFYCFRRDVVVGRTTWKCCLCPSSVGARRPPGEEEEKKVTWRFRHFWCGALPDCHYSSISSYTC